MLTLITLQRELLLLLGRGMAAKEVSQETTILSVGDLSLVVGILYGFRFHRGDNSSRRLLQGDGVGSFLPLVGSSLWR